MNEITMTQCVKTESGRLLSVKLEEQFYEVAEEPPTAPPAVAIVPALPPVPPPPRPVPPLMLPAMAREEVEEAKQALRVAPEAAATIAATQRQKITVEVCLGPIPEYHGLIIFLAQSA